MISSFSKFFHLLLVFSIIISSGAVIGKESRDVQTVRQNLEEMIISGEFNSFSGSDIKDKAEIIDRIATDADGDCYFSDINYEDNNRTNWTVKRHLNRTEVLAIAYRTESDEAKKSLLRDYVLNLLDYWIKNDFQNENWWHNKISVPNTMGEIGVLMKDDLSLCRYFKLSEIVGRGSFTVYKKNLKYTGANATDIALSTIKYGVLTNSERAIKKAIGVVANEMNYSEGEGIKKDGTFFQHGNRLYLGGYGLSFISGIVSISETVKDTALTFTSEQLQPFACFITDGLKAVSFGSTLDPTVMGRSASRYKIRPLSSNAQVIKKAAEIENMPKSDEILSYADSIENNTKSDNGVKLFTESNFIVINNSDFYFSFLGGKSGMNYSEVVNSENILGYNSSFPGVTTILYSGDELTDIAPIYDYSFVAGTTAVYETDDELLEHGDFSYREITGTFGSASADGVAVCFAKTQHEGISGTIACFATDSAAFILGAGFTDSEGRTLNTTINQCLAKGEYETDGNSVIHNNIRYTRLDGNEISVKCENRQGNWMRNNTPIGDKPAEGSVFTAFFENTGSYAYSVMSATTYETVEIIVNTRSVQAVKLPDGRIAAAFSENASFTYNGQSYSGNAGTAIIM